MDKYELAAELFWRGDGTDASGVTTTMYGTALSDSADGRVYVSLDGAMLAGDGEENSVLMDTVVEVHDGDRVIITVVDGHPTVTGVIGYGDDVSERIANNATGIADVNLRVDDAFLVANRADTAAAKAQQAADEAREVADATNQHFWDDDSGVHVSTEDKASEGDRNILLNSYGLLLRAGAYYLAQLTKGMVAFYDGEGNGSANVMANYTSEQATIGKAASYHTTMGTDGVTIYDGSGNILASFGKDGITLGRYSEEATVAFCKGLGYISSLVDKYNNRWLGMYSDRVEVRGVDQARIAVGSMSDDTYLRLDANDTLSSAILMAGLITIQAGTGGSALTIGSSYLQFSGGGRHLSIIPVYRAYNDSTKDHVVTANKSEYDQLVAGGWSGDGIIFYTFGEAVTS